MTGYVTMARVQGGRVRTLAWDGPVVVEGPDHSTWVPYEAGAHGDVRPPSLRERRMWLREELAMMTFFLLDPESWR